MSRGLVLTALALLVASCRASGAPDLSELSRDAQVVESNAGRYRVVVRFAPDPPPSGEYFDLSAWVFDSAGERLANEVELVVDAGMPQHQHGMNVAPVHSQRDDGGFSVEGLLFHMPGEWTVTFDVERAGLVERAQLVVDAD